MWEGCRNYVVRNYLRDDMKVGDLAFFYHSNTAPPGIVGVMEIVSDSYPDPTQFDPKSEYYDPKSPKENPRWLVRDVKFVRKFNRIVTLYELKELAGLEDMTVTKKGNRLSICRVEDKEWDLIMALPGL